jgi:hypothetical protein
MLYIGKVSFLCNTGVNLNSKEEIPWSSKAAFLLITTFYKQDLGPLSTGNISSSSLFSLQFGRVGDQTWGPGYTKYTLYHWAISLVPVTLFFFF